MKIETLRDLFAADPHDPEVDLVRRALKDLLNAEPPFATVPQPAGAALAQWRAARLAEIASVETRVRSGAWVTFGDREARRRDGLGLGLSGYGTKGPTRVVDWFVRFPQAPAEPTIQRVGTVRGVHLAEAMAAVDARWPMPAWWLSLDAETEAG